MIDYSLILTTHYSDKQWILVGTDYEGLNWQDQSQKPTKTELDNLSESTKEQLTISAQAKIDAKQNALNKLLAIGLTEEEIKALITI